jgi:hypothetical protein
MTVSVVRSDAQVQRDVLRELHWDPRVEERGVAVDVEDGKLVQRRPAIQRWGVGAPAGGKRPDRRGCAIL